MVAHALAEAEGDAAIQRLCGTDRIRDGTKVAERSGARVGDSVGVLRDHRNWANVRLGEAGEVDALGKREIGIGGIVANNLLLVANVGGVDAGVGVVLAEYSYTRLEG